jgi:large subunit ribosomal protein L35
MNVASSSRGLAAAARPGRYGHPTLQVRFASKDATSIPSSSAETSKRNPIPTPTLPKTPWERVIPEGVVPAYDLSLSFLKDQQVKTRSRLETLRSQAADTSSPSPLLLRQIRECEIKAEINDPSVLKTFRTTGGKGMMDQPVMQHLATSKWKLGGGLDLIMGRVYQNYVVPDLLPDLDPPMPLTLGVSPLKEEVEGIRGGIIESGFVLPCEIFAKAPQLRFQRLRAPTPTPSQSPSSTNPAESLYTLLVIDPDFPEHETHAYSQRLHYAKTDIPLSITSGEVDIFSSNLGKELLSWEPPAPPFGTDKHRLVFVLYEQTDNAPLADLTTLQTREDFDLRAWSTANRMDAESVVGINLFRCEWTRQEAAYIDSVWRDYHGLEKAPVYRKAPREMRYTMPLSAVEQRAEEIREEAWQRAMRRAGEEAGMEMVVKGQDLPVQTV